ncbi:MAG: hypothetical protein U5Q03_01965 [Bacteroidota bacterium]|nr:hypothetical protein [Bacteroidota bacterium]
MNIYYEAIGDINASYVPTSDGNQSIRMETNSFTKARSVAGTDDVLISTC